MLTPAPSSPATTPAIVTQDAARRLPRAALFLLCVAYVLAGFIGREPWKRADIAAFGQMRDMALGHSAWFSPLFAASSVEMPALLPYWIGAGFIQLNAWLGHPLAMDIAARVPFALLLGLALASTWYGVYCLARLPSAQPVVFAFGGQAEPISYARSLADGGLLALLAMLGLAQLAHETTPTLAQLAFAALFFYAVSASLFRVGRAVVALLLASFGLALSGAPVLGLALCLAAALARGLAHDAKAWHWAGVIGACGCGAALLAAAWGQWPVQWGQWGRSPSALSAWASWVQLWVWFTWPAWPLAVLALWRWRKWWRSMHIAWPAAMLAVILAATAVQPGADRTALVALPALACLAAMALPTLHRSVSALIDWFAMLFFALCGLIIWGVYASLHLNLPAKPAANVRRLLPGFEPSFSGFALVCAVAATALWVAVIVWRTSGHRAALWKSLVIPASGAVTCWVLLTTLWMPILNYARSYAPMIERVRSHIGSSPCIYGLALDQAQTTALQFHGAYSVVALATDTPRALRCDWLIVEAGQLSKNASYLAQQWRQTYSVRRRSSTDAETLLIFKRTDL